MLFLLAALALAADVLAADPVLATVNGTPITQADLDAMIESFPAETAAQARANPDAVLDQLVSVRLIAAAGHAAKVDEGDTAKRRIAFALDSAVVGLQLDAIVAARSGPDAVKAWYDAHHAQYAVAEAKARHIMLNTEADAKAVLESLRKGGDFAKLAADKSEDKGSAVDGGELGWFPRDRMVKEFGDAVFSAKVGAVVGPVHTQFGWHVIEVEGMRDSTPIEDVTEEIKDAMRGEIISAYLDELKAGATVVKTSASAPTLTPFDKVPTIPADAPRVGTKGAPVQVVVYLDLECPHCAAMHVGIDKVLETRKDIEVAYRHYPISNGCNPDVTREGHPYACEAARAVVCGGKESAGVLEELILNSAALSDDVIKNVAAAHGGTGKKWDACMADPKTTARVALDVTDAHALGVEGTPTLYVGANGKWWKVEAGPDQLGAAFDEAKAAK